MRRLRASSSGTTLWQEKPTLRVVVEHWDIFVASLRHFLCDRVACRIFLTYRVRSSLVGNWLRATYCAYSVGLNYYYDRAAEEAYQAAIDRDAHCQLRREIAESRGRPWRHRRNLVNGDLEYSSGSEDS